MYDRQTESLPQLTGQASVGVLTGTQLQAIPLGTVAWRDFAAAEPSALVLSQDTGFSRPYGTNPYSGYDDPDGELLFALPGETDARIAGQGARRRSWRRNADRGRQGAVRWSAGPRSR